jgi:hypothetical protein
MSSVFSNGLNTNGISSVSSENNLLLGGTNTNNIQLLSPIIGDGLNNITLNNNTTIKGNTTIDGNVSVNGIVTNSTPVTLSNQLTPKSYVDTTIVETGTIIMRASLVNPPTGGTGYYLCDGSIKNTTTDSALFAVIGYTYGGISPSPNFNLPNLLERYPVGPTTSSAMTYLNTLTGGVTSGNVTLTKSWSVGYSSGYDFVNKKIASLFLDLKRDLHCWVFTFSWSPIAPGGYSFFNFQINPKSGVLQELKYPKRKDYFDNRNY